MRRLSDLARERKVITALYAVFVAVLVAIAAEFFRNWVAGVSVHSPFLIGLFTIVGLAFVLAQLVAFESSNRGSSGQVRIFDEILRSRECNRKRRTAPAGPTGDSAGP
jgi:hypothetical protein